MDLVYVVLGVALSAACGFRVFVPLLVISIASYSGQVSLSSDFTWLSTLPALITLSVATIFEIVAYYVPWLDNVLDTVSVWVSVIAGIICTASFIVDMNPIVKWSLAVIAGGGIAGAVSGTTSFLRAGSSASSGGLLNFILSTIEMIISSVISVLSVLFPVLAVFFVLILFVMLVLFFRKAKRFFFRKRLSPAKLT